MERTTVSRRGLIASLAAAGSLSLAACANDTSDGGSAGSASSSGTYRIGVLQLTQHAALDASNEGFIAALDDAGISYEADQQNANNEQSTCTTIASTFANDGVDLILAIGTPAAQACLNATTEIPIVGTAITDFAESGLVESNDAPGGNLTGSSDMTPVADQIALLTQLVPDAAQVGLLYCTAESNSEIQIQMAEEALDDAGLGHERYSFSSTNELQTVVETMVGQVDAVYAPTDNTVAAAMPWRPPWRRLPRPPTPRAFPPSWAATPWSKTAAPPRTASTTATSVTARARWPCRSSPRAQTRQPCRSSIWRPRTARSSPTRPRPMPAASTSPCSTPPKSSNAPRNPGSEPCCLRCKGEEP